MSEFPDYPKGYVAGPCLCGGWPGGECLRCRLVGELPKYEPEPPKQPRLFNKADVIGTVLVFCILVLGFLSIWRFR